MAYDLEGRILEVCNCKAICPCWIGEDSDNGTCDSVLSYHVDKGKVRDVDVSGLTLAAAVHIPGNILKGNWKVAVYVDDKATQKQQDALLEVFTGKLGGPVADMAKLFGEVVGVTRAPISFGVKQGKGSFKVGKTIEADIEPFIGATGQATKLQDSAFSSIPGSPGYVSKASKFRSEIPELGHRLNLSGHNAVQGQFKFQA